jgi:hypothetical protein
MVPRVDQMLALAEAYRRAASSLLAIAPSKDPWSRAPARLCAIHAIELYLNAFLLDAGEDARSIRGRNHDLAGRIDACMALGLCLRRRTSEHLHALTSGREYLVTRYGPELSTLSEINRLTATMEEVARKVVAARLGRIERSSRVASAELNPKH